MRIWLDPALYRQLGISPHAVNDSFVEAYSRALDNEALYYAGDCGCDCEGGCNDNSSNMEHSFSLSHHSGVPISLQEYATSIWDHELYCAEDLYLARCDTTHWLACNPVRQGTVAVLDKEALALLKSFHTPHCLKDVAEEFALAKYDAPSMPQKAQIVMLFVALGFIIDTCQYESFAPAFSAQESSTLAAWLHVTNACNMGCSYCYISKSAEHMTEDVGKRAVDAVFRSARHSAYQQVHLKYAGGEALLRLPQVLELHDYALQQAQLYSLGLSATLLSNGAALTPRAIQQLKQRQIGVMISLDGVGAAHDAQRPLLNGMGSFRLVDRAITRLLACDLKPSINVVVSQRNLPGLPDLVAYLLERDLPFSFSYYRESDCSASLTDLQFSEMQMIAGMKAVFTSIEQHLTPRRIYSSLLDKASLSTRHHQTCSAGHNYLVIDQHGGIARCQSEITHTVTTIDAHDPLQAVRMHQEGMQVLNVDEKEGCRTCNWRYWCGGGCAALTYRFTGRNDIRSPNCGIYQALFPETLRLEALRLLKYTHPL